MPLYNTFIGIDIGKFTFAVAVHGQKSVKDYDNTPCGLKAFLKDFGKELHSQSLCVLETTGGYEMRLLLTLCDQGVPVHRANTRKVKNFIRSWGNEAKTDALDAKALAKYGFERGGRLEKFVPPTKQALALFELVQRRQDLKQMLVAEKNRRQAPRTDVVKKSCEIIITALQQQLDTVTAEIKTMMDNDPDLKAKKDTLKTIPGIGEMIGHDLLVLLPELGQLNRKQIASLAGLAPKANDSGKMKGYRSTGQGRNTLKPILFMAAMAARRANSPLKAFYENLINKGKKKMVALTALMRKIIVIANAKIRDLNIMKKTQQHT
jgi:transposase